jgi:prophage maintenance system killer protein
VKRNKLKSQNMLIYQAKNGTLEIRGDFSNETLWATQSQIAEAFGVDVRTISEHIKNIYKTNELSEKATIRNFRIVRKEGTREIVRDINHYNLDMILSVGYRVNSKTATQFRIWATKTLKEHIVKGYTINRKQIGKNYDAFMKAVGDIQNLLPEHITLDPKAILELVKEFSSTWVSLDAYDHGNLKSIGTTKKSIKLNGQELTQAISNFRNELLKKGEATDIFAQERNTGSVEGIVGNVMQSFGGKPLYESLEEKAAHLLYFIVKDHPYVDGNKRSGAFSFIWFLKKNKIKGAQNINPNTLTTLTLLIAESKPEKKELMVALITNLLAFKKK